MENWPKVSIVTPTLNAATFLEKELEYVKSQDYPKDKIEIVIADGGSTDATLEVAKKFGAIIVENKLKTAEAGKAVGVKKATGEFIVLLDSDNFLPTKDWLKQMITPLLKHPEAVGSEPWSYTWRKEDGFIDRYCALIGMNDPFVHFLGNYDRMNLLTGKWTEVEHDETDFEDYVLAKFDERGLPTIGANGTVFRSSYLKNTLKGDYLFDIDMLAETIQKEGSVSFIKVKNGIIHAFCGSDIKKFARKQRRRVKDLFFHKFIAKDRNFSWETGNKDSSSKSTNIFSMLFISIKNNLGMLRFFASCIFVLPLVLESFKGYIRKKDSAWFFHILACEITLWCYFWGFVSGIFKKSEFSREKWKQ